jgi:hypothetical protein
MPSLCYPFPGQENTRVIGTARPVKPGRAFCSRQILQEQGKEELHRQCERQNTHCNASSYIHSSRLGGPECGTGGCPPGHTITMISNAFSYIHSSRFGGSRLWYRRIVPRVIPSQVNSFFIVDKPIVIGGCNHFLSAGQRNVIGGA